MDNRDKKCRQIAIKAYRKIKKIYEEAWKEIDEYFDDEYEQQYSFPHLSRLQTLYHNGVNSVDKDYFKINH